MKRIFAITRNVERFTEAMDRLQNRESNVPGMALIYGSPGLGKTKTALWWAVQNDGIFVRTKKLMTGHWLLEEICAELGESPMSRTADLFRQIQSHNSSTGQEPLSLMRSIISTAGFSKPSGISSI